MRTAVILSLVLMAGFAGSAGAAPGNTYSWNAPDRGAKVAALAPGRKLPKLTPDTLFREWTRAQVERWEKEHPPLTEEEAYRRYAATPPTDEELTAEFPDHIAPFGLVASGKPDPQDAANVLIRYCPFCQSRALSIQYDSANPYHAVTVCCKTHLYGREQDFPADYALKPNSAARFPHLDGTVKEVPCTLYRDRDGVVWQLFIGTLFAQRRWLEIGCNLVDSYCKLFRETADPVYAHKIAVILDKVADTYYGLPLCFENELAKGKDGKPLTRAEWEAVPRPAIFEVSYLGGWNRRTPIFNRGWINMSREHIWVEPFARVRHHPAFRAYSQKRYGDPAALDQKIMRKLMRELALMFKSVFSQKLITNYQEANYTELFLLGVLLQDQELIDFAGPNQELTLYNHHYHDGVNGEGAQNYMAMLNSYYYPYLRNPEGWLELYPDFLKDHPFFGPASTELNRLATVRGLFLEFADQHEYAWRPPLVDPEKVRANEALPSRNWPGFGVGLLRVGGPGHRQEVSLHYSRATLHTSSDALGISCWVDGIPVMRPGGYAAHWSNAPLDARRPEIQALHRMGYPREIVEAGRGFDGWSWVWTHSALAQNTVTVDEKATSGGWRDDRGFGEVITYKGGEQPDQIGARFQVLDVRDLYSFERVGVPVSRFRRTLLGVEGPDGRPYVLDCVRLSGGQRHALYQSAWADRAEARLPAAMKRYPDLTHVWWGGKLPEETPQTRNYQQLRKVEALAPPTGPWEVTWKTDIAAYAPRDPEGKPFTRPLPDDVGQVRLRLIGVPQPEGTPRILSGKGPWIAWMRQPLPNGTRVNGYVAFRDALDFLIEQRVATDPKRPLESRFVHVLEGFREGERTAIRSVESLPVQGPGALAVKLELASGYTDTLLFQEEPGTLRLPDGMETDARYALLRRDRAGRLVEAHVVRGTFLRGAGFRYQGPSDFRGTMVDLVGDLTGTRHESALIVRPEQPWPEGEALAGRQLLIRLKRANGRENNEAFTVSKVTSLPGGLLRVDLDGHAPFAAGWHQVAFLDGKRPNVLKTHRPMVKFGNLPWYEGCKAWFPGRGKSYVIKETEEVGGGFGGCVLELEDSVNLAADGIRPGDWYVIYAIEPGLSVSVPADFTWRAEERSLARAGEADPETMWVYAACASGPATVALTGLTGDLWQCAGSDWTQMAATSRDGIRVPPGPRTQVFRLAVGKPTWLNVQDREPPKVTKALLDGQVLDASAPVSLGLIAPPKTLTLEVADDANPIDPRSLQVTWDGQELGADDTAVQFRPSADGRAATVTVDLGRLTGATAQETRRRRLTIHLDDFALDEAGTTFTLAYTQHTEPHPNAVYLSDLKEESAFAHGGLLKNRRYADAEPISLGGAHFGKGLMLCPETAAGGAYSEAIYDLRTHPGRRRFRALIGIDAYTGGNGSATFEVQVMRDTEWETVYRSPVLRGGDDPLTVDVEIAAAKKLRLYCTDAGDTINSDHAAWAEARLE